MEPIKHLHKYLSTLAIGCAVAATTMQTDAADRQLILDMVHHNPGESQTVSRYLDPDYLKAAGYGGKVFFLFDAA